MSRDHEMESRYIGLFTILDEQIEGEIICNRESGVILLILTKPLGDSSVFGKSYPSIPVIIGQINNGAKVTLFHNKRVKNHVRLGQAQNIVFITDYIVDTSNDHMKNVRYSVDGVAKKVQAFCLQSMLPAPPSNTTYKNYVDLDGGGDEKLLRKGLFYMYGGPAFGDTISGINIKTQMTNGGCSNNTD